MNLSMRLFQRRGWWHAEFDRQTRISLKTRDPKAARKLFDRLKRAYLNRNLALLEGRPAPKRLGAFVDEYLAYRQDTMSRHTFLTDRQALRRLVAGFGPETLLTAITRKSLDLWLAQMGRRVKTASANTWFRHVKAALTRAVDWGHLKDNPARGVRRLAMDEPCPRYLTVEEFHRLQAAEPSPDFRRLWEIYLRTGCRRTEILQIRAEDLNLEAGTLLIRRTKNRRPKTVPLPPELAALFRAVPVQVGRLFPWTPDYVTHRFQRTARTAGLTCRLHDLRHTYCSWLVQAGVDLQVVQQLAGHRSIQTTTIYAHLHPGNLAAAAGKIKIGE